MKTRRRRLRLILLLLLLVLIIAQFLPVDHSAPVINPAEDFVSATNPPEETGKLIKDACYDCHSYETEYPWYSYVSPVSQWLQGHIRGGRDQLNFSIWTTYSPEDADHAMKEGIEMVKEKSMPLKSFTWLHPEARLTDMQRAQITDWFQRLRTGASSNSVSEEEEEDERERK